MLIVCTQTRLKKRNAREFLTFDSGNFNPSEMSKTCIFVKNAFLFVLFTMIVKNVVPLFSFSSIYLEIKLVISNHFGIVRLKTQSEKYMALKDEISRGVMLLRYMPQRLQTVLSRR